jgi:hypothetical protein
LFGLQTSNNGQGLLTANVSVGIPALASMDADFSAYSDGEEFGFIPTKSSFDYKANPTILNEDIVNESVGDVMRQSPYDVVLLNADRQNEGHLNVKNPYYNLLQTCLSQPTQVGSYLLNREMGDDSLYLENRTEFFPGMIEAEQQLLINYRNPYYNYESQLSPIYQFNKNTYDPLSYMTSREGAVVFSKQRPYTLAGSQPAKFRSNSAVNINPADPLFGQFNIYPGNMTICCRDYSRKAAPQAVSSQIYRGLMNVYPGNAGDTDKYY